MEPEIPTTVKARPAWFTRLTVGLVLLSIVALVAARALAVEIDFAFANILTALISIALWISLVLAFFAASCPRYLWKIVLAVPFVAAGIFLTLFEFVRLDGELKPQFRFRWSPEAVLPVADSQPSDAASDASATDEKFVARETDYPQFLGPNRDGMLVNVELDTNWDSNPPEILWKQPIGEGWSGFAVQGDVAITMEQRGEEEWVTAYAIEDGRLLWHYAMDALHTHVAGGTGPRSTPTIANGRVYACSAVSQLACLGLTDGEPLWTQDLLQLGDVSQSEFEQAVAWGRAGSPLVTEQLVVVPLGGAPETAQPIVAFDLQTGEELWRGGQGQISYSSPVLAEIEGVQQILLVAEDHVAAFDPQSGQEQWRFDWPGVSNANASVSQPIVLNSTHVFTSKGYGQGAQLTRVSLQDGQWRTSVVWSSNRVLRTKFTNCVIHDGYVYGLSDGILECVDLATGQRQWKRGRYHQGQLLLVGGHLLISAESGELVVVEARPDEFIELARMPVINDVNWNTIALSGDRLLMRNAEEAACVKLPLAGEQAASTGSTSGESVTGNEPVL